MERTNNYDVYYPEIISLRKELPISYNEQTIINLGMMLNQNNAVFTEMINRPQECGHGVFEFVVVIAVNGKEFRHSRKEMVNCLFQSKIPKLVMSKIVDDVYRNIMESILIEGLEGNVNGYNLKLSRKREATVMKGD